MSNQKVTTSKTATDPLVAGLLEAYPSAAEVKRGWRGPWPLVGYIREQGSMARHSADPDQDPDEIPQRVITTLDRYDLIAVYVRGEHVVSWRAPPSGELDLVAAAIKGGPGRYMHAGCKAQYTALAVVPIAGELHKAQLAQLTIENGRVTSVTPVERHEPEHLAYAIEKMKWRVDDYGSEIQRKAWSE